MLRHGSALSFGFAMLSAAAACEGQAPTGPRSLGTPDAVVAEGFTDVAGLRELSDGRVLLVDPQERRIVLLGSDLSHERDVGRTGRGPGEFLRPYRLFALRGDTSAVIDRENARILLLDKGIPLTRHAELGTDPECAGEAPVTITAIEASDRSGRLYFTSSTPQTISILRWHPGSCRSAAEEAGVMPGRGGQEMMGGRIILGGEVPPPLGPEPAWAVGPGGRVAVAHPEPYRVTFTDAAGRRREGPAIHHDPLPLTDSHKDHWRRDQSRPRLLSVRRRGEEASLTYMPLPGGGEPSEWPATLPPFPAKGVHYAPDGTLWVQRWVVAGGPTTFDLINEVGQVFDAVVLPPERRLVAFGEGSVYAVVRDEFDLEYVERYRLR